MLKHWKYERFIKDYLRCIASVDESAPSNHLFEFANHL
jgi:hypothetical protein